MATFKDGPPFHDSGHGYRTDIRVYAYPDGHLHVYLKGDRDHPDLSLPVNTLDEAKHDILGWLDELARQARNRDNDNDEGRFEVVPHDDGTYTVGTDTGSFEVDNGEALIAALRP